MGVGFHPGIWEALAITGLWPRATWVTRGDDRIHPAMGLAPLKYPALWKPTGPSRTWRWPRLDHADIPLAVCRAELRERHSRMLTMAPGNRAGFQLCHITGGVLVIERTASMGPESFPSYLLAIFSVLVLPEFSNFSLKKNLSITLIAWYVLILAAPAHLAM